MGIFRRGSKAANEKVTPEMAIADLGHADEAVSALPEEIAWLLDAPMFIDSKQIEAFYDATLRPQFDATTREIAQGFTRDVQGDLGLNLGNLVPGLGINADGSLSRGTSRDENMQFTVVTNPYRHLLLLTVHYSVNLPNRLRVVRYANTDGGFTITADSDILQAFPDVAWFDAGFISSVPRALLFIDLPPGTQFIPAAVEDAKGNVHPIFEHLAEKFEKEGDPRPDYPGGAPEFQRERNEYWDWYSRNFNETVAMVEVEAKIKDGPPNWIAYRVALPGLSEPFLHLSVSGRGDFDTGTFAYNFVKRGFKHGLRIVGTLKSEPDLNVLAVFEK